MRHAASARLFDQLLDDLRDLGVLKRRGRQRTDSLAIHTRARRLNRMELVVESLRLAVQALVVADPAWSRATIPPTWAETYGQRAVAERLSDADRARLQTETGRDGQWLLNRLAEPTTPTGLGSLAEVDTLRTVWAQQYEVRDTEVIFRDLHGYDGTTQIQTPHEPEAR